MIQHIVLWTMKEGVDKEEAFKRIQKAFYDFRNDVPGMRSLELYRAFAGYDVVLISVHEDKAALDAYQNHPAHLAAKEVVAGVRAERASSDFEI